MRRTQEVFSVRRSERKRSGRRGATGNHERPLYREFLARLPPGSAIAVEASGHYNWLEDEMDQSGHRPKLCNPLEAKRRMGLTNKTDKLDARGLAILLRNGTLPEVWIPPSELRDQRELLRLRIFLVRLRTRVKNRIHAALARCNIQITGADLFGVGARLQITARLPELPEHSREAVVQELATLDFLNTQIESAERRLEAIMKVSAEAHQPASARGKPRIAAVPTDQACQESSEGRGRCRPPLG